MSTVNLWMTNYPLLSMATHVIHF